MTVQTARTTPSWLSLREGADAAARSTELVRLLRPRLRTTQPLVVHDLGCGTGSMTRWLAPQLGVPQHWELHDRDAGLLAVAARTAAPDRGEGAGVSVSTVREDVTRLDVDALAGASLVTASALLDLMTHDQLRALVASCAGAGCPVLFAVSVSGRVVLSPADPLDRFIAEAFNAHQRREVVSGRLLGPDAVAAATELFVERGLAVALKPSPWVLDDAERALVAEWLGGWVAAACEQRPQLAAAAADYTRRRHAQMLAGRLRVRVDHHDLLALPG